MRCNSLVGCSVLVADSSDRLSSEEDDIMQARRGYLIAIGALLAIAASAITALAVRAGTATPTNSAPLGAGSVAGPRDTVTVVGEGTQNAVPDNAVISLGVSAKRGSAKDALNAANSQMTKLLNAIKANGVQDKDIQTTGLSINQEGNGYGGVSGYRAGNTVNVKINHLTNVNQIISVAQQSVGDDIQLNGINLQLSDNTTQLRGARQAAMTVAAARAKEWASLAGRHLGKVLSVSEVVSTGAGGMPCYGQCGGGGPAVQPGQVNVTVDVAVVYELKD
jgi:uncharacterized protein